MKITRLHNPEKKQEYKDISKNLYALFEGRERVLDALERKYFQLKLKIHIFETRSSTNLIY